LLQGRKAMERIGGLKGHRREEGGKKACEWVFCRTRMKKKTSVKGVLKVTAPTNRWDEEEGEHWAKTLKRGYDRC